MVVTPEEHGILNLFCDRPAALDTKALTRGATNPSKVINQIDSKFPRRVRKPKKKGEGYFIPVRTLPGPK